MRHLRFTIAEGGPAPGTAGFTLVELLVVTAIIGILAAMVMGKYLDFRKRANEGRTKHEINLMRQALERYQIDHDNNYPWTVNDLVPDYMSGSAGWVVPYELVGTGPEPGNWVHDLDDINESLNRNVSAAANLGGWKYCRTNGDVWIDEAGTSLLDQEEFRLW